MGTGNGWDFSLDLDTLKDGNTTKRKESQGYDSAGNSGDIEKMIAKDKRNNRKIL